MLAGFHAIDEHFQETPDPARTCRSLMGLLAVWYGDFFGAADRRRCCPTTSTCNRFPAYLQQLTMESNGKHVTLDGARVDYDTGAIFWGEPGTNGQHTFYQLIHQGTRLIPLRLHRLRATRLNPLGDHHDILMANVFAQAEALAFGKTAERGASRRARPEPIVPHRVMEGNRPIQRDPRRARSPRSTLGSLVALYEHSVFTQGAIWGIDSFDQWGVELGKELADSDHPELEARGRAEARPRHLDQRADPALPREPFRRVNAMSSGSIRAGARSRGEEGPGRYLAGVADRPVAEQASVGELRASPWTRKLPEEGEDPAKVLVELADAAGAGPGSLSAARATSASWIGGTLPAALGADWLAWRLGSRSASLYVCGPSASVAEEVSGRWVLELLGLPSGSGVRPHHRWHDGELLGDRHAGRHAVL